MAAIADSPRFEYADAHNCCPDFDPDTNTSLFACYDGHGGAEVAIYTAQHLPDFIKALPLYKEGKLSEALEESFLQFDEILTKEDVIQKLKEIACLEEDGEQEEGEAAALYEEATMPLEELLERYGRGGVRKKLLAKDNIQSPAIRSRKGGPLAEEEGEEDDKSDVKMKLENELMNGHGDGENGLETRDSNEPQANEAQAKEEKDSSIKSNSSAESGSSCVDSTTTDEPQKETTNDKDKNTGDVSQSKPDLPTESSTVDPPSPAPTPSTTTSSMADKDTEGPSSTSCAGQDSKPADQAASSSSSGPPSSCRVGSTSNASGSSGVGSSSGSAGGSSSLTGSSGCSGSSSSSGVGSSGSACPGGSSADMGPCSSSKEEEPQAGSSTGRFRHKRKNIIPAEGEDESSFDEDSETESESDEDEPKPWGSGSDDSSEDDEDIAEGDEDEDDNCTEMGSGEPGSDSGCTAVVSLLRGRELYVANSGDSRCVVCRGGKAMDMSVDHKPEDEIEHDRVTKAGGRVTLDGRVNGGLNMSRAIGDHCYKQNKDLPAREQMITALPDVRSTTLEDRDTFMVLACDGIWNVMSSQDVMNFVSERLMGGATKLSAICEEMFDYCLAPDTSGDGTGCDNMTCIIATFNHGALDGVGSASKKRPANDDSQDSDTPDLPEIKKQKTEEPETAS